MMHPCVSSGVQVWAVAGFTLLARHVGHTDAVGALALDGNFLFSGSEDATIRVWDTVPARVGSGEHFRSWIVCTLRFGAAKVSTLSTKDVGLCQAGNPVVWGVGALSGSRIDLD